MKKITTRSLLAVVASAAAVSAQAATTAIDVTAATDQISSVNTGVLAIGLAVFGIAVSVKLYKWLRSAL